MLYFESLNVYQKAFAVNKEVYKFLKYNKSIPSYLKNQLGRASMSILLNIAEGSAKSSYKDRRNFLVIARGSTFECAAIVRFLASEEEIQAEASSRYYQYYEELSKMLYVMIKNSKQ